jgi:hypothetical protein
MPARRKAVLAALKGGFCCRDGGDERSTMKISQAFGLSAVRTVGRSHERFIPLKNILFFLLWNNLQRQASLWSHDLN